MIETALQQLLQRHGLSTSRIGVCVHDGHHQNSLSSSFFDVLAILIAHAGAVVSTPKDQHLWSMLLCKECMGARTSSACFLVGHLCLLEFP